MFEVKLTRMQRAALAARLDAYTAVDAAARLNLSPNALRQRVNRALLNLSPDQQANFRAALRNRGRLRKVSAVSLSALTHGV